MINNYQNQSVPVNQAQKALTDQALAASKQMETGDFSTLPKNMFFNFTRPAEQKKQYDMLTNASGQGTFQLGDGAGMGAANSLAGQYLKDKHARDVGANYQDNVANAAGQVQGMLAQSSDAEANRIAFEDSRKMGIMNAVNGLYQFKKQSNAASGFGGMMGGVLGAVGSLGAAAIQKGSI